MHIKFLKLTYINLSQRSAKLERSKVNGRWRYWLEQWVNTQLSKSKELEDLDSIFRSHSRAGEEYGGRKLKPRSSIQRKNPVEGFLVPNIFSRRWPQVVPTTSG